MSVLRDDPIQGILFKKPDTNHKFYRRIKTLKAKAASPTNRITRSISRRINFDSQESQTYITVKQVPDILGRLKH